MVQISGGLAYLQSLTELVAVSAATGSAFWHFSVERGWLSDDITAVGSLLVVSGNTVGPCGPIYAVDATSGRLRWQRDESSCRLWSDAGRLYLQRGQGDGLAAVDPQTGREIWSAEAETPRFVQSLAVQGGRIYADDRVIEAETGKTLFWWPRDQPSSAVLVTRGHVILATSKGSRDALVAYDPLTFARQWEIPGLPTRSIASVLSSGNVVYAVWHEGPKLGARRGVLEGYDISNGRPMWRHDINSCCADLDRNPVAVRDGIAVLLTPANQGGGDTISALNTMNGDIEWTADTKMQLEGPPVLTATRVFAKGVHGGAIALDASRGTMMWRQPQ